MNSNFRIKSLTITTSLVNTELILVGPENAEQPFHVQTTSDFSNASVSQWE